MRTAPIAPNPNEPDTLDFIMAFEEGTATQEEIIKGFQSLIDSGLVWSLQGMYGRTAMQLIQMGVCHHKLAS